MLCLVVVVDSGPDDGLEAGEVEPLVQVTSVMGGRGTAMHKLSAELSHTAMGKRKVNPRTFNISLSRKENVFRAPNVKNKNISLMFKSNLNVIKDLFPMFAWPCQTTGWLQCYLWLIHLCLKM